MLRRGATRATSAAVAEKPLLRYPDPPLTVVLPEHRRDAVLAEAEPEPAAKESETAHNAAPDFRLSPALRQTWRQWARVVEAFVQRQHPGIDAATYAAMRAALLDCCRAEPGQPGPRPAVLVRIEALVEPWLSLHTLAATDRDTLESLLARCQEVGQGLERKGWSWRWLGPPLLVSAVTTGLWYAENTWHVLALVKPWGEQAWRLMLARPVLSLGIAAAAVVLGGLVALSRLLRK
jgi:hypothetical protein